MSGKDKKYYWLKLKNDFFKRHDIRIIEGMPNGKDYVLFYLKLLVESVSHEGELRFSETIPYNEDMLSTITNTNIDIVRSAVKIFRELDMMEFLEDGTIFMQEVNKMIGHESYYAIKQREHRERKEAEKALKSVKSLTMSNGCQSQSNLSREEIDIEIDIEIDKDIDKEIYSRVIAYLNGKAGTNYKPSTSKNKQLINARLKEGFTEDDFKKVIDIKVAEWKKDEKMSGFIRPITLFGTKFESYLNQPQKEMDEFRPGEIIDLPFLDEGEENEWE